MVAYHVIGVGMLLLGLWNLMIGTLGLFPRCLTTTTGTLAKGTTRNIARTKYGRTIRTLDRRPVMMTRYAYTYTVNGRAYRYSGRGSQGKHRLLPKAVMVYVKWFPGRAYPNRFRGTKEWVLGLLFFSGGLYVIYLMHTVIAG